MELNVTAQMNLAGEGNPTLHVPEEEDGHLSLFLPIILFSVLTFTAFISNIGVIVVVLKTPHLRNSLTYVFVLNLCFIDLLATTTVLPVAIFSFARDAWSFRHALCRAHGFWTNTLIYSSIFSACSISAERYYSIRAPMHYSANLTFSIVISVILILWLLSLLVALLPIFGWGAYEYSNYQRLCTTTSSQSQTDRAAIIFEFVFCFVIPAIVILAMYSGIYKVAKHTATQVHPFCSPKAEGHSCLASKMCASLPTTSGCGSGTTSGSSQSAMSSSRGGSDVGPMDNCWVATVSDGAIGNADETPVEGPMILINKDTENNHKVKVQITFDPCQSNLEQPICSNSGSLEGVYRKMNAHWKAAKTLTGITVAFLLSWSPLFILTLCHKLGLEVAHIDIVYPAFTWLGFASFSINPLVYGLLNRTLREAVSATYEQAKACCLRRRGLEEEALGDEDFFQFLERTSTTRTNSSLQRSTIQCSAKPDTLVEESESGYEPSTAFP